jgi:hypothetical protein
MLTNPGHRRTRLPSAKPIVFGVVREGFCHLGHGCQRSREGCGDTIPLSNRTLFQNLGNFESISKDVVCILEKRQGIIDRYRIDAICRHCGKACHFVEKVPGYHEAGAQLVSLNGDGDNEI